MRVALSKEAYQQLRERRYVDQRGRCADCGRPVSLANFAFHHATGRGHGGGNRVDTDPRNRGLCKKCHDIADKNRDSKFVPIETT